MTEKINGLIDQHNFSLLIVAFLPIHVYVSCSSFSFFESDHQPVQYLPH